MNKAFLIGRLTKDPELRTNTSGVSKTTFTIAVNRKTSNEEGERQADFINCVAWRGLAETIAKYFTKGKEIAIDGHIQTGSYDAFDGTKRYTTDVIVDNLTFIGNKETNAGDKKQDIQKQDVKDPFEKFGEEVELGPDDLPF